MLLRLVYGGGVTGQCQGGVQPNIINDDHETEGTMEDEEGKVFAISPVLLDCLTRRVTVVCSGTDLVFKPATKDRGLPMALGTNRVLLPVSAIVITTMLHAEVRPVVDLILRPDEEGMLVGMEEEEPSEFVGGVIHFDRHLPPPVAIVTGHPSNTSNDMLPSLSGRCVLPPLSGQLLLHT